ncbi:hypothetical protein HanXRQr2_Chr09g0409801 [Helianthus annuus]|uniref:Uncharacterized protein n=1 Tax=Helianthus annuus TaxID=4232 RepID=A0A251U2E6_HELAN|nr:hypothetical protein HanXRQr2_Chr09g0409801 [Helianthus annuus]
MCNTITLRSTWIFYWLWQGFTNTPHVIFKILINNIVDKYKFSYFYMYNNNNKLKVCMLILN